MLPIAKEISYQDPATLLVCLSGQEWVCFLDSAKQLDHVGRYSFIVYNPFVKITASRHRISINHVTVEADPFLTLQEQLSLYQFPTHENLPPFQGGAVGYFSYDLLHHLENVPRHKLDTLNLPEMMIGLYDTVIAFDHERKQAWVISYGLSEYHPSPCQKKAEENCQFLINQLAKINNIPTPDKWCLETENAISSNFDENSYKQIVQRVIDYIYSGDIFQENVSQCFSATLPNQINSLDLYLKLREKNPAPFAAFLDYGNFSIASASPERFLKLADNKVETRPIKGTRRRSANPIEDEQLANELLASVKDRAENTMITDLMRNDLSRVSTVNEIIQEFRNHAGIVSIQHIKELRAKLAEIHLQKSFLVQVGDCAEPFEERQYPVVLQKVDLMTSFAKYIPNAYQPLLVGRIAGQYAKPRSFRFETRNSVTLPAYHGDLVNRSEFTPEGRKLNPALMFDAYEAAREVIKNINAVLADSNETQIIYTSHEALQLFYEEGLTRAENDNDEWYNLSMHFPWLGMRTAIDSDAHIEYLRGIRNPIAIKLGPFMAVDKLIELIEILNPTNELGRITLIHRLGEQGITGVLPRWISAINKHKKNVVWSCDPMHGNTELTAEGIKTRRLSKIISELEQAFDIHQRVGSFLGGIHLELTPYMVTECIDEITVFEHNLSDNYKTLVDPRLNPIQARQVMEVVSKNL